MRVCLHKITRRLWEAQSACTWGTMLGNMAAAGLDPNDYEELEVSDAEFAALLEAAKPPPTQDELDREATKADTVVQYLQSHTPAECAEYVRLNVTDLASAKALLEKFAMLFCVLSRRL